jgi:hypothetical protein
MKMDTSEEVLSRTPRHFEGIQDPGILWFLALRSESSWKPDGSGMAGLRRARGFFRFDFEGRSAY